MGEWVDLGFGIPDVNAWLGNLDAYASSAIKNAENAANSLNRFNPSTYYPNVNFKPVDSRVSYLPGTARPTKPSINTAIRNPPSQIDISTPTIILDNAPTFTEPDPSINLPDVPDPLNVSAPVKDFTINTSFNYPVEPNTTLPEVPTLLSLNIPTALQLDIPTFSLAFPSSSSLIPPGVTFAFNEDPYSSALLTKVKDELLTRLSGGTGLSPEVEEAIWNRGRDREQRASLLAERTLLVDRASQGFTRPSGAAQAALSQLVQDTQSKIIDLSREIMIKQAELEQENIKTSIQQTIALEDILIRNHQQMVQRSFEVAKYTQDLQIELFKILATKYNSEVEAYKAFGIAYQARVQAELSKVEILKAQIDAEKLKGEINEQNIKIYLAKIDAIKNNVEIYKSLVATISEKLKAEGLKLEVFKADIEAYAEVVKAKATEFQMYSEQMKGELAKVDIHETKAKVYATRVQGYSELQNVKIKKADTELKVQELNLKKYEADLEAFIKMLQSDQLVYQSAIDIYKGETAMYVADSEVNKSASEVALKNIENTIVQNKYTADIAIENARIALEGIKSAYLSILEAKKAAGSIYQSIGSSALSAINVSAQVQGSAQLQLSEDHNYAHQG